MQVSKEDTNTTRRVGVQEDKIKFRPSPNFIKMKKFLKNRSDYTETTPTRQNSPPPAEAVQAETTPPIVKPEVKPVFQPPLPTYPPPPDSPPNIKIKTEKEDDIQNTPEECEPVNPEQLEPEKPDKNGQNGPKKTMCKEWVRGNCKRPVCKYSHELDISQLRGVYTFCWNYQNDRCTYPYCRYVHASIFEEAEFYRSGTLPPHAKAHLKKSAPPPPPPDDAQSTAAVPQNYVTMPVLQSGMEKMPVITCVPPSVLEQRPDGFINNAPRSKSPLKRDWNELEDFTSSPRDVDTNEHLTKKCNNCAILEFRLQYNKEKVANIIQETEEISKKINNLNKKNSKLTIVLQTIFNSMDKGVTSGNGDNKNLLELSSKFLNNAKKTSSLIDDSAKSIYNGGTNITNLMAKILCVASDQTVSPDSRET